MNLLKTAFHLKISLLGIIITLLGIGGEIEHTILVKHPGISLTKTVERTLVEIQGTASQSHEFYMDVETVVCGDSRCRIDIIRIFWDELGFYKRIELPRGIELEKAEGAHFSNADYEKLNQILSNKKASLKDVYKEEVVGAETTESVDGLSGATIILNTNDYVAGAVWTCYTLWHWANGETIEIIRNLTGDAKQLDELIGLLQSENKIYQLFALEQIFKRKAYQVQTVESVIKAVNNNPQLLKLGLQYIESATPSIFLSSIKQWIDSLDQKDRLDCLSTILNTSRQLPQEFYSYLSYQIPTYNDYQQLNLYFNILESKDVVSPDIIVQLVPLLDHTNFLIARRAYWFLEKEMLNLQQRAKWKAFGSKFTGRL